MAKRNYVCICGKTGRVQYRRPGTGSTQTAGKTPVPPYAPQHPPPPCLFKRCHVPVYFYPGAGSYRLFLLLFFFFSPYHGINRSESSPLPLSPDGGALYGLTFGPASVSSYPSLSVVILLSACERQPDLLLYFEWAPWIRV